MWRNGLCKYLNSNSFISNDLFWLARYPNIACDLLTSDVTAITDALAENDSLLQSIYAFLECEGQLNPLQASFFSKTMGLLITHKSEMVCELKKFIIDRV